MQAVEAELASADESDSSGTSVSMATAVRNTALTKAKEAKRLFSIAGALTEIEAMDPTGTKPRNKERGRTGMAASSSTEVGNPGAEAGLTPKSQDQDRILGPTAAEQQTSEYWQGMESEGYSFPSTYTAMTAEVTVQAVPKAMLASKAKHAAKAKGEGIQLDHKFMEKLRIGSARDRQTMRERKKDLE